MSDALIPMTRGLVCLALLAALPAAAETVGTLTLDALSFVSFQDEEVLPLPAGSTVRFHFDEPQPTGSVTFSVAPEDVSIAPISLSGSSETLHYTLAGPISGVMQPTPAGRILTFTAPVHATLAGSLESDGTQSYSVAFSTETASAATELGSVEAVGSRLDEQSLYVQLVGATQNSSTATPQPGKAVYTVLSGSFDQVPE